MTASLPPPTVRQSSSDCRPLPDRVALPSRSLASMAYDHDQAILQIEFRGGTVYQYFHVPRETYQDLLQADSKGAYFNRHIRSIFRHVRLHLGASSVPCRQVLVCSSLR